MSALFESHRETLERAVSEIHARGYWSAYPEMPSGKIYGESAKDEGEAAFKALLGTTFPLDQPSEGTTGAEASPYGLPLAITYPTAAPGTLIEAANAAATSWAKASVEERVGVCLEALHRLNRQSFLMANAVMHTTGQSFIMAFQAGGAHAQDRGLEAVAYAYEAMTAVPASARWEKPQGKNPPLVLEKTFRIAPRGVGLVIGCSTFPTWNSYSALFANLATGNASIVKPHPMAILPLAITVKTIREVLAEAGFDPNVVLLAADDPDHPVTMDYIASDDVDMIDFTGSATFGATVRAHARGRPVFTEEAGVNPVVITGTDSFKGMCGNLAMSLSLYSGQMCTAPQSLFVPAGGIDTDEGHKSVDEVGEGIAKALDKLLGDTARAMAVLGAVQNPATLKRVAEASGKGRLVRPSAPVEGAGEARTATPAIVAVDAADEAWREECFGPVAFLVTVKDAADGVALAAKSVAEKGAITAALYATDEAVIEAAEDAFAAVGAPLSVNLTGPILVNQSAAFSDYHVTGLNPAGTATLTDLAFVTNRFSVATVRRPVPA
ncbi:phenylacetic acid degradation protein PaaN [Acuticoccus mangrovi]|uniref:Phenylacetic acid degradation protein PaaN n=1 Tax=Acuticoccus mangrovi TaxID=2796142 RepID=A0A934IUZ0_9HYPH|nr:phenylacetic acid degradation protein PaaN [Acuticoccus mangrovi]MBJ3778209.1 phenylacetic acid degradation protein PaaN [Acuticoccus mangrovi]